MEFKKIGVAPGTVIRYSTRVDKGFKYYFRVRAMADSGITSEYSKTVQYEYK
ncbi:MAG: hypothetical protein GY729_22745 [Desulfobacteraceae bacterium]|nr:hypothetical protein [Desulfobacteraceae bacterium]